MRKSYSEWKADQGAQELYEKEKNLRRRNRGNAPRRGEVPVQSLSKTKNSKTRIRLPLLFAVIVVLSLAGFFGKQLLTEAQETKADPTVIAKAREQERQELLANPIGIPDEYVQLLSDNPDTLEFVENFPNRDKYLGIDFSFKVKKGDMPDYKQWDLRWGFASYGNNEMVFNGCGPTALSLVSAYLTGDNKYDPLAVAKIAEEGGYYVSGVGTKWELMGKGSSKIGLKAQEVPLSESAMKQHLEDNRTIIAAMGPGDFTTAGHYIVIYGVNDQGNFLVKDPNSFKRSNEPWLYSTLEPQIKNLWAFSK